MTELEKGKSGDRIRDVRNLALFVLAIALVCTVVMDILAYPLSLFAFYRKELFTTVVRYLSVSAIALYLVIIIIRRILFLSRNGIAPGRIMIILLRSPLRYITSFLFTFAAIGAVGILIYLLLNFNNLFLHTLGNIL